MPTRTRTPRGFRAKAVRQSVTIPVPLVAAYRRFMNDRESASNRDAGKDLIRAIFGKNAIPEDTAR